MIRSESEYREAIGRLEEDRRFIQLQREALEAKGYSADEVAAGLEPAQAFHEQLADEVAWYERAKRHDFGAIKDLTSIGRLLIALRVGQGLSQRDLAGLLGVSEAVVSRDERNEYHGIGVERAQRILDALGAQLVTTVETLSAPPTDAGKQRELIST
jgi:DNA-directed RNA polymerase specialized sigma subunit